MPFSLPPPPPSSKKVYRGDTIIIEAVVTQDLATVDLTGYDIYATFKLLISDADNAATTIQKSLLGGVENGIELIDAVAGEIKITLEPEDTIQNTATVKYLVDIQLMKDGVISTPDDGTLTVSLDITEATI